MLLLVISAKGQSEAPAGNLLGDYYKKHNNSIKPQLSDSLIIKFNSPAIRLDSIRMDKLFKRLNPQIPYFNHRPFNENDMAFNPGPSNDRMPNAVIATPGIHYQLKIIVPGKSRIVPYPGKR
jgi:hypothetical protein